MSERSQPVSSEGRSRRHIMLPAGLILAVLVGWWLYQRWTHVSTEDARIASSMIEISSSTSGLLMEFPISSGDALTPGDLIAQLDDRSARLELQELGAQSDVLDSGMDSVRSRIEMTDVDSGGKLQAAKSKLTATLASLASAESDLEFNRNEMERAESLKERQIIPAQQWENARNAFRQSEQQYQRASAEVESARAAVTAASAGLTQLQVLANELSGLAHEKERLALAMERKRVQIDDMRIEATRTGVVDQTFVEAGEYIVPGQRIALMHDPSDIWVNANIKETEFRHVKPGLPVSISVDAFPDQAFAGEVLKVGDSATSQYSLLPNTSPSANFTKVTQRLPVKISVDAPPGLLRPGMMVEVAIEIR